MPLSNDEFGEELARLRSLGLSDDETMPIILQKVMKAAEESVPRGQKYWERDWAPSALANPSARATVLGKAEASLRALYGPGAEDAMALASVFRPLQREYPFLSPAEQQAVIAARIRRLGQQGSAQLGSMRASPSGGAPQDADLSLLEDLSSVLPIEKARAVALRESTLAQRIRASDARLSEEQFGRIFDLLVDARRRQRPVALRDLGAVVEKPAALRVLAQFDPSWPRLSATSRSLGLSDQAALDVFAVVKEASDELAGRLKTGAVNQDSARFIAETLSRRNERIRSLVGSQAAPQLLAALNEVGPTELPPGMRPLGGPMIQMPAQ
ncbi:MAG: hypothetical protein MUE84_04260 [Hyphomonas sp.]|nr:hypothetical protein [Hyphomonas sp.]